jgi:DNA-binding MarR family transcriptional regulator
LNPSNVAINKSKEDFPIKVTNDAFGVWIILDYTRFAIARLRDYELSRIGATPEQAAILQILARREGKSTIGGISQAWMRRANSVSTMVRRMEKLGLVRVIKYPKRKELEVVMTDKGKKIYEQISRLSIEAIFSVLSDEERQKLSLYLRLLFGRARNLLELTER